MKKSLVFLSIIFILISCNSPSPSMSSKSSIYYYSIEKTSDTLIRSIKEVQGKYVEMDLKSNRGRYQVLISGQYLGGDLVSHPKKCNLTSQPIDIDILHFDDLSSFLNWMDEKGYEKESIKETGQYSLTNYRILFKNK